MSSVDQNIDLAGLTRREPALEPPRRSWVRIAVPLALLAAFAFVLRDAIAELLTERVPVTLTRPVRLEGPSGDEAQRALITQAAGWVEPDPFLVHVPALAAGVVLEVMVQESDEVALGAPVARLIDDDARLRRDRARALLSIAEAETALATSDLSFTEASFEAAIEVTADLETARAKHAGAVAAAEHAAAAVRQGAARVSLASSEVEVQASLEAAGTSGPRQVEIAEADLEAAHGLLAALQADAAIAVASRGEAAAEVVRAERTLELRFEERRIVDTHRAHRAKAAGQVAEARAALAAAELELERMIVRAPMAGIVLERLAVAGDHLPAGRPVCSLYNPERLRVRVDVPQADVGRLAVGMDAEILADSRPGEPYTGEVLRIVQLADIQKVTLEVQVRIKDSDRLLRPDMLAQVRFFSSQNGPADGATATQAPRRMAVPRDLLRDGLLWVYDPRGERAVQREVETGASSTDASGRELIEIVQGLDWTVELIDQGRRQLPEQAPTDGVPVRIEPSLGASADGGPR